MQFVPQNAIMLMSGPNLNSGRSASRRFQDSVKFWSKPDKTARSFFSLVHQAKSKIITDNVYEAL